MAKIPQHLEEVLLAAEKYGKVSEYTPTDVKQKNLLKLTGTIRNLYTEKEILEKAVKYLYDQLNFDEQMNINVDATGNNKNTTVAKVILKIVLGK